MTNVTITAAQREAASKLPFALSNVEIVAQFNKDGFSIDRNMRDPMATARSLARSAMNDQVIKLAA